MPMNLNEPHYREELLKTINKSIIGQYHQVGGPFKNHKIIYCDWIASGRSLTFIEDYIRDEVLPLYSNTHTTSSALGHQISLLREEARIIIARTINASDDKDTIIFTGHGMTGALDHLLRSMRLSPDVPNITLSTQPVVFLGFHEHHSNLLPWRESKCILITIPEDCVTGMVDLNYLEEKLIMYLSHPLRIGSFSAASNVTGVLQDVPLVSQLLHRYGALSFWDYATAAPYTKIDMNPVSANEMDRHLVHIDALFISPHKFIGGASGTPGLLVAKKILFNRNLSPCTPGGGTVDFVTPVDHLYIKRIQEREEAGTPGIIGCIRAGLVFQLKHFVTHQLIARYDAQIIHVIDRYLRNNPYLHILGPKLISHRRNRNNIKAATNVCRNLMSEYDRSFVMEDSGNNSQSSNPLQENPSNDDDWETTRLPIFSFVIYHHSGRLLHYNFICTLFSDLFGIQSRGGCLCSGPYTEHLLGINLPLAERFKKQLHDFDDVEVIRPGFTRLSISYFTSQREIVFIARCIDWVARNGWKFLPYYTYQAETNEWHHSSIKKLPNRRWLGEISYADGKMTFPTKDLTLKAYDIEQFEKYIEQADYLLNSFDQDCSSNRKNSKYPTSQYDDTSDASNEIHSMMRQDAEDIRWFVYPSESRCYRIKIEEHNSSLGSFILHHTNIVESNFDNPDTNQDLANQGENSKAWNYHNSAWRSEWAKLCPLVPRFYDLFNHDTNVTDNQQKVSNNPNSLETSPVKTKEFCSLTIMPKANRQSCIISNSNNDKVLGNIIPTNQEYSLYSEDLHSINPNMMMDDSKTRTDQPIVVTRNPLPLNEEKQMESCPGEEKISHIIKQDYNSLSSPNYYHNANLSLPSHFFSMCFLKDKESKWATRVGAEEKAIEQQTFHQTFEQDNFDCETCVSIKSSQCCTSQFLDVSNSDMNGLLSQETSLLNHNCPSTSYHLELSKCIQNEFDYEKLYHNGLNIVKNGENNCDKDRASSYDCRVIVEQQEKRIGKKHPDKDILNRSVRSEKTAPNHFYSNGFNQEDAILIGDGGELVSNPVQSPLKNCSSSFICDQQSLLRCSVTPVSVKSVIRSNNYLQKKRYDDHANTDHSLEATSTTEISFPLNSNDKNALSRVESRLFKRLLSSVREFDLLSPGDRVLVGVSGGKDSLTLLNILLKARRYLPFPITVGAVTIDPQTLEYDPSPLKHYMTELGIDYIYDSQPLMAIAGDVNPTSICSWCSRMKRGILHNICEKYGYNILALGHHLDDLAESFFMYAFHNGQLDTMKASTVVRSGRLKIIRPFVFVRERDTRQYSRLSHLPIISENCPACFEEPKERARMKALLKSQEALYPGLFGNLLSALRPLMHSQLHLDQILNEIEERNKVESNKKYYPKRLNIEDMEGIQQCST